MFNKIFSALIKEAQFTREMLGSGATQIRSANYATKGVYFQAFTSLSTGLERIGKLCLMLDYYIDHSNKFPDSDYMRNTIGHSIELIYTGSMEIVKKRSILLKFTPKPLSPIHQAILKNLSEFARGDRYSNINLVTGDKRQGDPIASWFTEVDLPLYTTCVSEKKKKNIHNNAIAVSELLSPNAMVRHVSETGTGITVLEDASIRTGVYTAVAPYRQLYVLQIIRYWIELLTSLQNTSMQGNDDIPDFGEIFAPFYNSDTYFKTRKTWETL
ncbi:MAG: hypothetical protein A2285_00360 [Elusimicrobia bacterium RIFOXYA12_FULL_57_11]|nr:MAG: hypothetical protein A2285_00360 [Elusimicrobia bacterium RIFOXYA12_FULL_57_11]